MKKTILIALAFASVFTACKKNDGNNGPVSTPKKYLSREIWSGTDTLDYSYDANKMLVKAFEYGQNGTYNTVLNYQNGKLSTINSGVNASSLSLAITCKYDGSGRVQKVINGDGYKIDSITYNSNGTINKIYSFSSSNMNVPNQVTLYTWDNNGNIATIKHAVDDKSLDNNYDYITTCSYDNKINPKAVLPVFYTISEITDPSFMSPNNLVKDVLQERKNGVLQDAQVRVFSYTYDSDGYPTGYTFSAGFSQSGPIEVVDIVKLEYLK